ncbi:MAG: hypothetical protein ACRD0D_09790 [Acidimicrobiales bacterium]
MRPGRLIVAVLNGWTWLLSMSAAAWADQGAGAWTDDTGIGATAETDGSLVGVKPSTSRAKPTCTYPYALSPEGQDTGDRMAANGWGPPRGEEPGKWYRRICYDADGNELFGDVVWLRDRADPSALAQRALSYTPLTAPGIGLNPAGEQVVNVATWLWVDPALWSTQTATASVAGLSVTTTATPQRVIWDLGNGDSIVCGGPGTPYDSSKPESAQHTDCSYMYRRSSAGRPDGRFVVTATGDGRSRDGAPVGQHTRAGGRGPGPQPVR